MASPFELDVIKRNPIKNGLDSFRSSLQSRYPELGNSVSDYDVRLVFSRSAKAFVLDLIQALLIEPAARALPSRTAKRSLSGDLAMIYALVDSDLMDFNSTASLIYQVIQNTSNGYTWSDMIIWLAVFEMVAKTNPLKTPHAFQNIIVDAPPRFSSSSRIENEKMRNKNTAQINGDDITHCTSVETPLSRGPALCATCAAIDFDAAFSLQIRRSKGKLICLLDPVAKTPASSQCPLCRLFMELSPGPPDRETGPEQRMSELRAFSSLVVYGDGRRDVKPKRDRIHSNVKDSVFLAVVPSQGDLENSWHRQVYIAPDLGLKSMPEDVTFRVCEVKYDTIDFSRIVDWLHFCRSHHKLCNSPNKDIARGLKVIDCSTRNIIPALNGWKYAALSYVWGLAPLSDDLIVLDYLPVGTIPVTIEDAIKVTVNLGLRYLWIDRYCINQCDQHEKHIQVSQMDIVYSNAEFTIIAAAGDNPMHGLPGMGTSHRVPQPSAKLHGIVLRSTLPDGKFAVDESSWSKRGWTYQEAILSRRRLVFTRHQVYFQCNGMHCCESIIKPLGLLHVKNKQRMKAFNGDGPFSAGGLGKYPWQLLDRISEFTGRRLSYESDSLNAMLGILNAYKHLRHPVFHYYGVPSLPPYMNTQKIGVAFGKLIRMVPLPDNPENGLATGLCWFLDKPSQRRYGFPSWSWAGWSGKVSRATHDRFRYFYGFPEGQLNLKIWIELGDASLYRWGHVVMSLDELQDLSPFLHIESWTIKLRFQYLPGGLDGMWGDRERLGTAINRQAGFYARFEVGESLTAYSYLVLTKDVEFGSGFYNKLNTISWTGIVFGGHSLKVTDVRSRGPFIMVVDSFGDYAERIGHLNLFDFECNWLDESLEYFLPVTTQRVRLT
ncbi:heterokaryon incompatibility protein-domain-containing protein [Tricladium varicosporioides]|nr:heterokaryon incompatibility protein-domain-containing protein [Hymenoscyphus varicosporioides]